MSKIKIALVGNPNCGKTTMFNELTGSNQYVGNWPGVTVEHKEGQLKGRRDVAVIDLPGIYSLSPYTPEEVVSRNYLINGEPDVILNLVDASNIERNLYLTTQCLEMGVPVAIAMNMMDIVRSNGDDINIDRLAAELGCQIVETSALLGEGVQEAAGKALSAVGTSKPKVMTFSMEVEHALHYIQDVVGHRLMGQHERWLLIKLFERDHEVMEQCRITPEEAQRIDAIIRECEELLDDDAAAIITKERYDYIEALMHKAVVKAEAGLTLSDKIDAVVTNRYLALPIFAAAMFLVYYIAVETIGSMATDWVNDTLVAETIQPWAQAKLEAMAVDASMISLVVDGIIGGVGAPLGFAPQMAVVFLMLSFLEDCGYMSRIAFIMDSLFRKFGMSGRSFIPLLISAGCGVPGIMSARTIISERDRRLTMMTTTFIPCSAKLPVIALFAGAIMGGEWWMAPCMYFIGFAAVLVASVILKKSFLFDGEPTPFVMELPPYHMPLLKNVLMHTWERVSGFIKKAGTIIFLCCVVMWYLATYGVVDGAVAMVEDTEHCFLAILGGAIAPLFAPIGFGSWQAVSAAFSGFIAKESIVSTLAILGNLAEATEEDEELWKAVMAFFPNAMAAFSFLIFNLLDSPCLAAVATMAREQNSAKWAWATIIFQNGFAYCVCFMTYQLGRVFVLGEVMNAWTYAAAAMLVVFLGLLLRPESKGKSVQLSSLEVK